MSVEAPRWGKFETVSHVICSCCLLDNIIILVVFSLAPLNSNKFCTTVSNFLVQYDIIIVTPFANGL